MKTFWQLVLIGIVIMCFSRCSTTNKTKSVTKTNTDSTSIVKIDSNIVKLKDSTTVKKDNTVTTIEKEDNYVKETTIEFDTSKYAKGSGIYEPSGNLPTDYFQPIKKITIKETGTKKEKKTIAANKIDSTSLKSTEKIDLSKETKTELVKTETTKNKVVERTSYWGWLWLLLLIPAYLVYRNWNKIKAFI